MMKAVVTTTATTSTSSNGDDDWLVVEILTRLPVKSLVRFKTVCKNWSSLIQEDQHFIDLHLTRSKTRRHPRIFIVVPLPHTKAQEEALYRFYFTPDFDPWPYIEFHITADLLFEDEEKEPVCVFPIGRDTKKLKVVVDTVSEIHSTSYHAITKPLNGLICLIGDYKNPGARIRHISTGQESPWFQSTFEVEDKPKRAYSLNGFGFDPATNEHKLVLVWNLWTYEHTICEVLTIGGQGNTNINNNNNRWRRIKDVPRRGQWDDSVYANGVIYWTFCRICLWGPKHGWPTICLLAFDVGSEKFRTIDVPDFIIHQSEGQPCKYVSGIIKLLEVDGNLAMLLFLSKFTFKMYIYEDNDYKDKRDESKFSYASPRKKNGRWCEVSTITLPFHTDKNYSVKFNTYVGSDDKIFVSSVVWGIKEERFVSLYCYNWKKDSWTEIDVSGIPSSVPQLCPHSFSTTFFESLLSVSYLNALLH